MLGLDCLMNLPEDRPELLLFCLSALEVPVSPVPGSHEEGSRGPRLPWTPADAKYLRGL